MTILVTSGEARAEPLPGLVYSAGVETGLLGEPDEFALPQLGAFVGLAWTPGVPDYTDAGKGYIWQIGPAFDASFGNGWLDGDHRYVDANIGARLEIAYSQRRMGFLGVSARGGFHLGGRIGIIHSDALTFPQPVGGEVPAANALRRVGQVVAGTYVLLGPTGWRLGAELIGFGVGASGDQATRWGGTIRLSVGFRMRPRYRY